ncbi:sugar ABC transporter permease [candidate division BRC1 bacterium HGW-BRC1-1]|jgi:ABC-type sugar transport system permease subunit|nr:MAG: sugar ABC transporter permease [candidate division BRC1 bacterium HGW-BRC1-1]
MSASAPVTKKPVIAAPRPMSRAEKIFILSVLGPALIHFTIFTITPVTLSLILSFSEWQLLGTPQFVGLKNYIELFHDETFRIGMKNTFLYVLMYVPPMLIVPLGLAMLINRPGIMPQVFRSIYFLPVVTSFVVFALIFKWIFSAEPTSLANQFMHLLGLPAQSWLANENQALPLLAFLGILKGAAWNMIYFIAGLQGIPDTFYEAARIDGANRRQVFRNVTLPLLRPTLYFVSVLTTIGAFQVFDSAFLLTQGGPNRATTTIVYFVYQAGFEQFRMGYASASAYVLLVLVFVVTYIQKRWLGKPADWY